MTNNKNGGSTNWSRTPEAMAYRWHHKGVVHLNDIAGRDFSCRIDVVDLAGDQSLITVETDPNSDNKRSGPDRYSIGWLVAEVEGENPVLGEIFDKVVHLGSTPTTDTPNYVHNSSTRHYPDMVYKYGVLGVALPAAETENLQEQTFNLGRILGVTMIDCSGTAYPIWHPRLQGE